MIEKLRKINLPGKVLILSMGTIIIGFFSGNRWFIHRFHDFVGNGSSGVRIDWEWVILLMGLTSLFFYFLLFGFKKKMNDGKNN